MEEGREIRDYEDLLLAFRARAQMLNVSRNTLDATSGLANGYCGKLLSLRPRKHFGPASLGALLSVLGLKLIAVPDPQALALVSRRLVPKQAGRDSHAAALQKMVDDRFRKMMVENARRGAAARNARLSPDERSASARRAVRARWKQAKKRARASRHA